MRLKPLTIIGFTDRRSVRFEDNPTSGLYCKPMTIVNDDARVINKLEASLTDDT